MCRYGYLIKRRKTNESRQKRAREWNECRKSKKVKAELTESKEDLRDLRNVKFDPWLKFQDITSLVLQVSEMVNFSPLKTSFMI